MEKSSQNHHQNCEPKIIGHNQTQIEKEKEEEWEWEEEDEDAEDVRRRKKRKKKKRNKKKVENKEIECKKYFGEFGKVVGLMGNNNKKVRKMIIWIK